MRNARKRAQCARAWKRHRQAARASAWSISGTACRAERSAVARFAGLDAVGELRADLTLDRPPDGGTKKPPLSTAVKGRSRRSTPRRPASISIPAIRMMPASPFRWNDRYDPPRRVRMRGRCRGPACGAMAGMGQRKAKRTTVRTIRQHGQVSSVPGPGIFAGRRAGPGSRPFGPAGPKLTKGARRWLWQTQIIRRRADASTGYQCQD